MSTVVRVPRRAACLLLGHRYPVRPVVGDDEAPVWRCSRCGNRRWTEPPDFWSGAGHLSGNL